MQCYLFRTHIISLTGEELRDYRLYAPDDLIYRAAWITDFQIWRKTIPKFLYQFLSVYQK